MFQGNAFDRTIYVPAGSLHTHQMADGWSTYFTAIFPKNY